MGAPANEISQVELGIWLWIPLSYPAKARANAVAVPEHDAQG